MKKLLAIVSVLGLLATGSPTAGAGPSAGGFSSDNIEWLTTVRFETGTATGAEVIGKYLYVTSWKSFSIYDVSDPLNPQLLSITPFGFKFENEDVSTNGKILIFSESTPQSILHVWDVEDKENPEEIATLPGAGQHTMSCLFKCQYLYGSGGAVIDLRDPAKPKVIGNWGKGMPATSGHDVNEVSPGIVLTSSRPIMVLDARKDPAHPKLLAVGDDDRVTGGVHSNKWPQGGKDRFALVGSESNFTGRCSGANGAFMTWDARNWQERRSLTLIDIYQLENGTYQDGKPAVNASGCSAHWFEEHPSFHNGGLVALGSYDHGMRLIDVSTAGKISEVGFFEPMPTAMTSAAYWLTDRIIYSVDYERGIDVLKYTGKI
ncbi:MAG: hypothetical protein QOK47_949 [Actinomycetota bacterium]|nr:hypothetical protein [Actinomycetota bacterium]